MMSAAAIHNQVHAQVHAQVRAQVRAGVRARVHISSGASSPFPIYPVLWNLKGLKKGFVLSLDSAIASFVVILVLAAAYQHMSKAEEQKMGNIQMTRTGSDIVAVLQENGTLATLDATLLEAELSSLLPAQNRMVIRLTTSSGTELYVGGAIPDDRFVGTGKRYFLVSRSGSPVFGRAEYFIWRDDT